MSDDMPIDDDDGELRKNAAISRRGRPFEKGNAGKPKGARHKATAVIEALLEGQAEQIGNKCIERALAGDGIALKLVMERLVPLRKGRPVTFDIPDECNGAADLSNALGAVLKATSVGALTPDEASAVSQIIDARRRAIETVELEQRVQALEKVTK